jgi:hypothetical protein
MTTEHSSATRSQKFFHKLKDIVARKDERQRAHTFSARSNARKSIKNLFKARTDEERTETEPGTPTTVLEDITIETENTQPFVEVPLEIEEAKGKRKSVVYARIQSWRKSLSQIRSALLQESKPHLTTTEAETLLNKLQQPIVFVEDKTKKFRSRLKSLRPSEAIALSSLVENEFPYVVLIFVTNIDPVPAKTKL